MPSDPVLQIEHIYKTFKLYQSSKQRIMDLIGRRKKYRQFRALSDINFCLEKGEVIGIIGENGSGKSTLLKLIAGIIIPDRGQIIRRGRITGLLELGTGFNPHLSGRKNIYLNGVYLKLSLDELKEKESAIIEFAELGDFIDAPIKTYSSGMLMRLGFSIGIHAEPQCFIIDEALGVGDIRFQQKCFNYLKHYRASGGSLLLVSHDLNMIKKICDRVLLLDRGEIKFLGAPEQGVNKFNEVLASRGRSGNNLESGYGNGDIILTTVKMINKANISTNIFTSGEELSIVFNWHCQNSAPNVVFGILIRDHLGQDIFGTNGQLLGVTKSIHKDGMGRFEIEALNLGPGLYSLNLAAHSDATHLTNCFHWWDNALTFEVLENSHYQFIGLARIPVKLKLS